MHPHSRFRTVEYATSEELLGDTYARRLLEEGFDNHHFILAFAHLGLSETTGEAKSDTHGDSNKLVAVAVFEENEAVGIVYATDETRIHISRCKGKNPKAVVFALAAEVMKSMRDLGTAFGPPKEVVMFGHFFKESLGLNLERGLTCLSYSLTEVKMPARKLPAKALPGTLRIANRNDVATVAEFYAKFLIDVTFLLPPSPISGRLLM